MTKRTQGFLGGAQTHDPISKRRLDYWSTAGIHGRNNRTFENKSCNESFVLVNALPSLVQREEQKWTIHVEGLGKTFGHGNLKMNSHLKLINTNNMMKRDRDHLGERTTWTERGQHSKEFMEEEIDSRSVVRGVGMPCTH